MTDEHLSASTTIDAPAEAVFAVLADPATHAAIDGTGWVGAPKDPARLTGTGQVFRMAMYHLNHPDRHYEMANRVEVFDEHRAIAWQPGQDTGQGEIGYGGWFWRYDLTSLGRSRTEVTLDYDWSKAPAHVRELVPFPAVGVDHLSNSLRHLARLSEESVGTGGQG